MNKTYINALSFVNKFAKSLLYSNKSMKYSIINSIVSK